MSNVSMPSFDLSQQVVLVTGASSGLGLYFAKMFAHAGATVVVAARRVEKLQQLVMEIVEDGGNAVAVAMDVTSEHSVAEAFESAEASVGTINVVVNNAGLAPNTPFLKLTEDDWDSTVDTNLKGAWLVSREAAKRLAAAEKGGSIINIASILGLRVAGNVAPYCASKAGLLHLTKSMALELARYNIRVNAIAPGYIETDLNKEFFASEPGQRLVKRIPQRRLGQLENLGGPLMLLASDASAYMTGSVLEVDGGHLCSTL